MSKPIKVLHSALSYSWGGLEIYTVELIQKLQGTGLQQQVLCFANSRISEELHKSGVQTVEIKRKLSKFQHARLVRRLIRTERLTHLHSHTRKDMWACALAIWNLRNIKHIYNLYMNAIPKQDFVHRWLFSKVHALCSSSESVIADVKKNFPIAPERVHLVRYGRNDETFKNSLEARERIRASYNVPSDKIVIGTLCRIDPGKGVRELVMALEQLSSEERSKIQLWIVGDPTIIDKDAQGKAIYLPESLALIEWMKQQSTTPTYNGLVHIPFQKDYVPFLDALDIFALASHNETYSLSVIDAMLMAKPVIGTNAGGTTEQVGEKNQRGYLVEPRSSSSIAEAIRYYLKNKESIASQGKDAQSWALENHSWNKVLTSYTDLYKT
ncbi:glycosyltransferase family 4 protein [Bdellovibrio sp. 22V]|uniref:glycosyltransferase family 4 protein n=1 Tax=Bdellovibrio sp. 22V TaxID=3044166 RepID=UPI002543E72B|nr:glycosyltransferase family 4 protein [Bdellovibrio sp. 22V]WII70928.1 glycosyltransferase family 4 protein [Bdellovibrio sp. 22V]